jgi:hypothetical protein
MNLDPSFLERFTDKLVEVVRNSSLAFLDIFFLPFHEFVLSLFGNPASIDESLNVIPIGSEILYKVCNVPLEVMVSPLSLARHPLILVVHSINEDPIWLFIVLIIFVRLHS